MSITLPDAPATRPVPKSSGRGPISGILRLMASLQLTVVLMALAVGLVFFGTLAQKETGLWTVVDRYFWSWIVMVDVNHLLEFGRIFFGLPADLKAHEWAKFPWPGGKLLFWLMLANLLTAQFTRLRLTWKRSGVYVLHGGLLLLFVGEYITREFQVEQQMAIPTGQTVSYAVDTRNYELAFVTGADADTERVTVVPAKILRRAVADAAVIRSPDLPFDLKPTEYFANATLGPVGSDPNPATAAAGLRSRAVNRPEVSGIEAGDRADTPAVYVSLLKKGTDESLGTYLFSLRLDTQPLPAADGVIYAAELRLTRHYKPYTVRLEEFRFDRYQGTEVAKNYSSRVTVNDPERGGEFTTTIAMNEPLRHRGETFYQQSFTPDEKTTILQVVRNPGWILPYVACVVVSAGLLLHFTIGLVGFLRRSVGSTAAAAVNEPWTLSRLTLPLLTLFVAALLVVGAAWPRAPRSGRLDLTAVAKLPVLEGGRIKPLDTVARVDMRLLTYREEFADANGNKGPAIRWLLDVASAADGGGPAAKYPIFRIENDQVQSLLQLKRREGLRYSFDEIRSRWREFLEAAAKADAKPDKERDLFDVHVLELKRHLEVYVGASQGFTPALLPPTEPGGSWEKPGEVRRVLLEQLPGIVRAKMAGMNLPADPAAWNPQQKQQAIELIDQEKAAIEARHPSYAAWEAVLDAYRANDPERFDAAVAAFADLGRKAVGPSDARRVQLETTLNQTALFYHCTWLYALAALTGLASWLCVLMAPGAAEPLRRVGIWLLIGTLVIHTATLIARMYLMDRPLVFVTNLYSTAVFIGWGAVIIGLLVERILPLGVGAVLGAAVGLATSILAHNLAASGDTLQMMQAVLDTNFWLATHVTTINLGYSASYLAGAVGFAYLVLGLLPREMGRNKMVTVGSGAKARRMELGKAVGQALYGVVCLALLLSFVGTVLGGIWGDQSWGRFWGWDPKENGALLIVIWNALILHARWCGMVKERGMALLALAGNMIVTWSYFGTNQLGVGLHAYGFSKELVAVCWGMWVVHAALIGVGLIPWHRLRGAS